MRKPRTSPLTWIERALLKSQAYGSLRSPTAFAVLAIFWTKRQFAKVGRAGKRRWIVINNGEITFSYKEARTKLGISDSAFRNAIDELRNKGFLDIAETGMGLYKSCNLYRLSDRWKQYGTDKFEPPKLRPKGPGNQGFRLGNQHGRNCRKTESTVVAQHSSTVTGQHSGPNSSVGHVVEPT